MVYYSKYIVIEVVINISHFTGISFINTVTISNNGIYIYLLGLLVTDVYGNESPLLDIT